MVPDIKDSVSLFSSKSLNDFDLEVYAMAQVEGEDEPVRLTFPDEVIKNKRG